MTTKSSQRLGKIFMDAMRSGSGIFRAAAAAAAHKTQERERELPSKQEPKRVAKVCKRVFHDFALWVPHPSSKPS
jgi:hypothetical protein